MQKIPWLTHWAIKDAESKVAQAYVQQMKDREFENYAINVSDGDVVSEILKLALNAAVDLMVMGTSTDTPLSCDDCTAIFDTRTCKRLTMLNR